MIEGRCPRCGLSLSGWALLSPRYQTCPYCLIGLEITEDGRPLGQGFSPFTAKRIDAGKQSETGDRNKERDR